MKKFTKVLCLFLVFSSIVYSQEYVARNSTTGGGDGNSDIKVYSIGTGISFNYFYESMGVIVDSYHFFNAFNNNSDKLLLKFGMGLNYSYDIDGFTDGIIKSSTTNYYSIGAIITASLGYVYVLNDINIRGLESFGAGFSVDYTYISSKSSTSSIVAIQTIGATLQITLNDYLIGLGAGAIIHDIEPNSKLLTSPYARISFGITF